MCIHSRCMLQFVGTLQICTPMFDVNLILSTYGLIGVFIEITLLELANCYFLRDAIAHPCPLVSHYRRNLKIGQILEKITLNSYNFSIIMNTINILLLGKRIIFHNFNSNIKKYSLYFDRVIFTNRRTTMTAIK